LKNTVPIPLASCTNASHPVAATFKFPVIKIGVNSLFLKVQARFDHTVCNGRVGFVFPTAEKTDVGLPVSKRVFSTADRLHFFSSSDKEMMRGTRRQSVWRHNWVSLVIFCDNNGRNRFSKTLSASVPIPSEKQPANPLQ
jgi:hypothetical protein